MFQFIKIFRWNLLALLLNTGQFFRDNMENKFVIDGFEVGYNDDKSFFPVFVTEQLENGKSLEMKKLSQKDKIDILVDTFSREGIELTRL